MIPESAHNFLSCSTCSRQLADVVTTKNADVEFNYVALCPYCEGESQTLKIKGLVHIGSVKGTLLKQNKIEGDKAVIHLSKELTPKE